MINNAKAWNQKIKPSIVKKDKRKTVVFVFLFSALVFLGLYLLLEGPATEAARNDLIDEFYVQIQAGNESYVVNKNLFPVHGEAYEFEDETKATEHEENEERSTSDEETLFALGSIMIPSIDLELPLWDSATVYSLRFGAAALDRSVLPGEVGNLVILGHRMKAKGSLFNRLGEVKSGDEVLITTTDGKTHTYVLFTVYPSLLPAEAKKYFSAAADTAQITLVTCTPTGIGTHRIVLLGNIKE